MQEKKKFTSKPIHLIYRELESKRINLRVYCSATTMKQPASKYYCHPRATESPVNNKSMAAKHCVSSCVVWLWGIPKAS